MCSRPVETHSIRDFLIEDNRSGLDWEAVAKVDPRYFETSQVDVLCRDATKAPDELRWQPSVYASLELVRIMVEADMSLLEDGFRALDQDWARIETTVCGVSGGTPCCGDRGCGLARPGRGPATRGDGRRSSDRPVE